VVEEDQAPVAPAVGVRQARKQRTRQSLLDAALRLMERQSLSSVGLREVTREADIAPAAFYRHFTDLAELGVALVEESFGSLHAMIREIRGQGGDVDELIARSVDVVAEHVHEHRAHFRFLARERHGGVAAVRTAIAAQLDGFVRDLVEDLSGQPESAGWSADELRSVAELYVNHTMLTAAALLDADADSAGASTSTRTRASTADSTDAAESLEAPDPSAIADSDSSDGTSERSLTERALAGRVRTEQQILESARMQLRLISLGRCHWHDDHRPSTES
jgi:AcrR family transcriptional regulator